MELWICHNKDLSFINACDIFLHLRRFASRMTGGFCDKSFGKKRWKD